MFKNTDFHRLADDKIRMVIETDDQTSFLFFQMFSELDKHAYLYHYRFRTTSKLDLFQKNRPARMEQLKRFYAEQLEVFRKLDGTRFERFRLIKLLRESKGEKVTLDKIMAEIKKALDNERDDKFGKVLELLKKGYSPTRISNEMNIPKATISRYCKRIKLELAKNIKVSSSPSLVLPFRKSKS